MSTAVGGRTRAGCAAARPAGDPTPLARVLVGVDFGVPCVRALEWVAEHLAPRARLHLVYVLDPTGSGTTDPLQPEEIDALGEQAGRHLEDLARGVSWGRCSTEVRVGVPSEELLDSARDWAADLVAVGPHTHPGGPKRALGSTAEPLLACSPVPVVLSTHVRLSPPRRVVAVVHDPGSADAVLAWGGALAGEHGADLEVARLPGVRNGTGARDGAGRPGARILEILERESADLLVLGAHPSRPMRVMLDTTVRTVVASAPCPVLLVSGEPCPA
jgi:nucleotide-binding universal stress UspA family protein